jgi:hypothetical protein
VFVTTILQGKIMELRTRYKGKLGWELYGFEDRYGWPVWGMVDECEASNHLKNPFVRGSFYTTLDLDKALDLILEKQRFFFLFERRHNHNRILKIRRRGMLCRLFPTGQFLLTCEGTYRDAKVILARLYFLLQPAMQ